MCSEAPAHAWLQKQTMCSSRAECCRYTLHCCGQTEAAPVECHPWGGGRAQLERLASDHSGRATHATEPRYPRPGSSKLLFSKTAGEGVRRHLPTAHLGTGAVLTVLQLTTHLFLPTVLRWRHCWPHFTGKKSEALLHLFLHSPRIYSYAALTPLCRHLVTFINSDPNTEHSSLYSGRRTAEIAPLQKGQEPQMERGKG